MSQNLIKKKAKAPGLYQVGKSGEHKLTLAIKHDTLGWVIFSEQLIQPASEQPPLAAN